MANYRWSEQDLLDLRAKRAAEEEAAKAKYGGASAARLAEPPKGKRRERVEGMKWLGDKLIPDEDSEQSRFFDLVKLVMPRYPFLRFLHHVPNEGKRSRWVRAMLKRNGLVSGVPDIRLDLERESLMQLYVVYQHYTVKALVPDVERLCGPMPPRHIIAERRLRWAGLVIEMKAGDEGPSKDQAEWLCHLAEQEFACFVCWSGYDAFNVLMEYIGAPERVDENGHIQGGAA